ncbi:hypothetical protein ILYODFUR_013646 [Ilyodon furcidens]|uniref:Uncharacterized protein n=1 Tax=Ilyodon furcidens TaxID=33524 RepID=A0ABV0T0G5_9TELE
MVRRPTHLTTNHSPAPGQGHRRKHWRKATTARQGPGTRQPHTQTPEEPQDAGHPPSRTAHPTAPSKLASPSIKAKPHLNQHCTPPGQDLAGAQRLPNRRTGH